MRRSADGAIEVNVGGGGGDGGAYAPVVDDDIAFDVCVTYIIFHSRIYD